MAAGSEAQAADILRRHEGREGPLLPILHDVQAEFGCVPAEACQSMNAEAVAPSVLDHFDLGWGGTTPAGCLTVEATYCLGLCACAPSAMLDGEPMARLTPASVDEISREVRR